MKRVARMPPQVARILLLAAVLALTLLSCARQSVALRSKQDPSTWPLTFVTFWAGEVGSKEGKKAMRQVFRPRLHLMRREGPIPQLVDQRACRQR